MMPTNRLFRNRLRAYHASQRKQSSQPIPVGFAVCPVNVAVGSPQFAAIRNIYQVAYESARRNAIPFYLRPVLGAVN